MLESNNENVNDSQNEEENIVEPLLNLNISLNNGQKTSLIIYDDKNMEKNVKDFCIKHKISPQDENLLLQRVKEELENNVEQSESETINKNENDIHEDDQHQQNLKYYEYIPKEKRGKNC